MRGICPIPQGRDTPCFSATPLPSTIRLPSLASCAARQRSPGPERLDHPQAQTRKGRGQRVISDLAISKVISANRMGTFSAQKTTRTFTSFFPTGYNSPRRWLTISSLKTVYHRMTQKTTRAFSLKSRQAHRVQSRPSALFRIFFFTYALKNIISQNCIRCFPLAGTVFLEFISLLFLYPAS